MRVLLLIVSLFITACAPSTEIVQHSENQCAAGQIQWCDTTLSHAECACLTNVEAERTYRELFQVRDQMRRNRGPRE